MTLKNDRLQHKVMKLIEDLPEPKLKWSLKTLGLIKSVDIDDSNAARILINLITTDTQEIDNFREMIEKKLTKAEIILRELVFGRVNVATKGVDGVGKIILVGSGKGGVGKSSVSVNLATGLSLAGAKVGLMDADIFGPSIPQMMGVTSKPEVLSDEYLMPIEAHGVKIMSVGFLIANSIAIEWRGVVAAGTLLQFIHKTFRGELYYLIIDMPPGAGDIHQSLAHELKADGAIVVTTPQEVVRGDVRRSIDLFQKYEIPILGLIENMSFMICEHCNGRNEPFSASHLSSPLEFPVIAHLPLSQELSRAGDSGVPAIVSPNTSVGIKMILKRMALKVLKEIDDSMLPALPIGVEQTASLVS
jgi:Mrp family chromosome partitioning ATPase